MYVKAKMPPMSREVREHLSVMLDLAMVVANEARCTCPTGGIGHVSGCDYQIARLVVHHSANMLNMTHEQREEAMPRIKAELERWGR